MPGSTRELLGFNTGEEDKSAWFPVQACSCIALLALVVLSGGKRRLHDNADVQGVKRARSGAPQTAQPEEPASQAKIHTQNMDSAGVAPSQPTLLGHELAETKSMDIREAESVSAGEHQALVGSIAGKAVAKTTFWDSAPLPEPAAIESEPAATQGMGYLPAVESPSQESKPAKKTNPNLAAETRTFVRICMSLLSYDPSPVHLALQVLKNCAGAPHDQGALARNSFSPATWLQVHTSGL